MGRRIRRDKPMIEYTKQIMIDIDKESRTDLNKLSNEYESWRSAANQSDD